jgi:cell division protein FtsI/penicillin-binding protein 2
VLALSEQGDEVVADPLLIKHPDKAAARLASLVGLTPAATATLLRKPNTQYVVLNKNLPAATGKRITDLGINGINLIQVENRVYPRNDEAAQVLGWVGSQPKYNGGIEYSFNKLLSGTSGKREYINDSQGKPLQINTIRAMKPGANLRLTLSAPLQAEVEQVLAGVGREYHPKGATAIVTDPQTDQLLAVANWPQFNPNHITAADATGVDGQTAAVNDQAVGLSYEPGSTFKAITVAGALQDGVVTPNTSFYIPSVLRADGHTVEDAEDNEGDLTVAGILRVSSNIGAVEIGQKLGANQFAAWTRRFGFGKPTGVGLPGEQEGQLLPRSKYYGFAMYNLPFGQGQSVTPMQMVQAYDAIANGGVLRTPQIVDAVNGKSQPEPKGKQIISSTVASELRGMLRGVVTDSGTASGAAIKGYDIAGKTGTAQIAIPGGYSKTEFMASFIGMVPASDPKLVVMVLVDEPQGEIYGGSVAAPAFQKIAGWAVPYFGINPCPTPVAGVCQ